MLSVCRGQALGGEHMRKASSSTAALGESVLFSYPFTVSMTRQTRGKKRAREGSSFLLFGPFTNQNPFLYLPNWKSKCVGQKHSTRVNSTKKKGGKKTE